MRTQTAELKALGRRGHRGVTDLQRIVATAAIAQDAALRRSVESGTLDSTTAPWVICGY